MEKTIFLKPFTMKRDDNGEEFIMYYGSIDVGNMQTFLTKKDLLSKSSTYVSAYTLSDAEYTGNLRVHFYRFKPTSHTGVDYTDISDTNPNISLQSSFFDVNYNSDAMYNDLIHYLSSVKFSLRDMLSATHNVAINMKNSQADYDRRAVYVQMYETDAYINYNQTTHPTGFIIMLEGNTIRNIVDNSVIYREESFNLFSMFFILLSEPGGYVTACIPEIIYDKQL